MTTTKYMLEVLQSRGMTQKRIAALLGCTQAAVSTWMKGGHEARGVFVLKLQGLINGKGSGEKADGVAAES